MRIKANMIGFWKKKKDWEFSQEVLEEGEEILYENPERGWYEIYTFPVEEKIDPQELKWSRPPPGCLLYRSVSRDTEHGCLFL